jgi:serine protease
MVASKDPARDGLSSRVRIPLLAATFVAAAFAASSPPVAAQNIPPAGGNPMPRPGLVGGISEGAPDTKTFDSFEPVATAMAGDLPLTVPLSETDWDIPGQIVVDARDDLSTSDISSLAKDFSFSFTPTRLENSTRIEIASAAIKDIPGLLARLLKDPRVEHAEPLAKVRALFVPNDPEMKQQWHMTRINAPRAWDFGIGRGVTVAVIDTGIACEDHGPFTKGTDLLGTECVPGWNFVAGNEHANDDQGHGTHVAGTIAQSTNNGLGVTGVAFGARLMPVKVLNEDGWGTTADVADGIRWAADNGAHVINLSLGGPRNSAILQSAVDHALKMGVVVVAAAGNTGSSVGYPGASDGVIGVSATNSDDKLASFSSRGKGVDIAAPGVKVVQQTICEKGRNKCVIFPGWNGTSMASPHVAGAAALVMGLGVTDASAVEDALRDGARKIDDSERGKLLYGAGILDAGASASAVTTRQTIFRLVALLLTTLFVARAARKKSDTATNPWRLDFILPALATGPGLFFFAPWILPRVNLIVDLLARPVADMDLLIGVSLHRFLPLANALLPFAFTAVFFGVKRLRPFIAGLATGTAAYLFATVAMNSAAAPFGRPAMLVWCALNAMACMWIARTNLAETR